MHRFLLSLTALALVGHTASAQACLASDFKKGTVLELITTDAKQKVTARSVQTLTNVTDTGGTVRVTFHQQHDDNKNKPTMEGDFALECTGPTLRLDMRAMAGQQEQARAMDNMEFEMEGDHLEMPLTATPG